MERSEVWNKVDEYFGNKLLPSDSTLEQVLLKNKEADIPEIDVSPAQGKFLYLLTKIKAVKNVLEIGTLGGYSSIWFARALPEHGKVYTLEIDPDFAKVAKENIRNAQCEQKVDVLVGEALDTLPKLKADGLLFDLFFIDADKQNNPQYLKWALELANPGALIIADNVVRDGLVVDVESTDERVQGVREFVDLLENNPRLESTAIQTVGSKGYDGFIMSVVK